MVNDRRRSKPVIDQEKEDVRHRAALREMPFGDIVMPKSAYMPSCSTLRAKC
jgi:hypothetical protein